jgi:hypothetical protein
MLVPFAAEKHHEKANQVPIGKVRELARRGGLVSICLDAPLPHPTRSKLSWGASNSAKGARAGPLGVYAD